MLCRPGTPDATVLCHSLTKPYYDYLTYVSDKGDPKEGTVNVSVSGFAILRSTEASINFWSFKCCMVEK